MRRKRASLAILAVCILLADPTLAIGRTARVRLAPADVVLLRVQGAGVGTSGQQAIQSRVLAGDPTSPGPYTIEILVPPHTRIAAHTHRDDRSAVVVSGIWYLGYGNAASEAELKLLPQGSFYTEPGGEPHFAMTRDVAAVIYISGFGPTDTQFATGNPP